MRSRLCLSLSLAVAYGIVAVLAAARPAGAQERQADSQRSPAAAAVAPVPAPVVPPATAVQAPMDRSLLKDGTLNARMLDIPPFAIGPSRARRPAALPALYAGFIALEAYDGYSTSRGLAHGAAESNPLVRWAIGHPAKLWAVKASAAAVSIIFAERLWRGNRRAKAVTVMVLSNAVMGFVAVRNARAVQASR
ncbi:MAG: hypothetical protein IT176_12205 [Acidobacteria bacterium]|nr:hypothetical protein [Acidobacteriota bacterium]